AVGMTARLGSAGVGARAAVALDVAGRAGGAPGAAATAVALEVAGRVVAAAQPAAAAIALDVARAGLVAQKRAAASRALERAGLAGRARSILARADRPLGIRIGRRRFAGLYRTGDLRRAPRRMPRADTRGKDHERKQTEGSDHDGSCGSWAY